jgi:phosphatidylinositol alpha-1,6-mannosyltransferase
VNRRLNMLALVTDAWGGRGGIAQYNRDFLGALARCAEVGTITVLPRAAPDAVDLPVKVHQAPPRGSVASYVLSSTWTALRQPVDAVFCGHLFMAPLAWALARLKGAKLVVQAHGVEVWRAPTPLRRRATDAADLALGVSRHTRASIASWSTLAPERLIVVPNTVSGAFTPGEGDALRRRLGLGGKRVLLTVGRMWAVEREKGHDRVIGLLPRLIVAGQDVVYVVIGDGDDRPRLEALAHQHGVVERLLFLGPADQETTVEAYRMADVFLMPSRQEGFGIAFLEAMACGTPAVGLAVGGTRDALADGELGGLVDEEQLSATVLAILQGPRPDGRALSAEVRRRFGQDAFDRAVRSVAQRIQELVAHPPPALAQGGQA